VNLTKVTPAILDALTEGTLSGKRFYTGLLAFEGEPGNWQRGGLLTLIGHEWPNHPQATFRNIALTQLTTDIAHLFLASGGKEDDWVEFLTVSLQRAKKERKELLSKRRSRAQS